MHSRNSFIFILAIDSGAGSAWLVLELDCEVPNSYLQTVAGTTVAAGFRAAMAQTS